MIIYNLLQNPDAKFSNDNHQIILIFILDFEFQYVVINNFKKIVTGSIDQFRRLSTMSEPLDKIPDVIIDPNGVFKYILVYVHDDNSKQSKPIVRGYKKCKFHGKINCLFT